MTIIKEHYQYILCKFTNFVSNSVNSAALRQYKNLLEQAQVSELNLKMAHSLARVTIPVTFITKMADYCTDRDIETAYLAAAKEVGLI